MNMQSHSRPSENETDLMASEMSSLTHGPVEVPGIQVLARHLPLAVGELAGVKGLVSKVVRQHQFHCSLWFRVKLTDILKGQIRSAVPCFSHHAMAPWLTAWARKH